MGASESMAKVSEKPEQHVSKSQRELTVAFALLFCQMGTTISLIGIIAQLASFVIFIILVLHFGWSESERTEKRS